MQIGGNTNTVLILQEKDHSYFITPRSRVPAESSRFLLCFIPLISLTATKQRWRKSRRMVEDGWEEREHTEGGAQKGGKRERESRT